MTATEDLVFDTNDYRCPECGRVHGAEQVRHELIQTADGTAYLDRYQCHFCSTQWVMTRAELTVEEVIQLLPEDERQRPRRVIDRRDCAASDEASEVGVEG
jgi:5-methylcytosine-specific restriction endonuclease McrA